jgi:hypothetical protein
MSGGGRYPLLYPHRESARWGVRDLDMFDSRAGHIRKGLVESGDLSRQIWEENVTPHISNLQDYDNHRFKET